MWNTYGVPGKILYKWLLFHIYCSLPAEPLHIRTSRKHGASKWVLNFDPTWDCLRSEYPESHWSIIIYISAGYGGFHKWGYPKIDAL